jgi:hypothetical protein
VNHLESDPGESSVKLTVGEDLGTEVKNNFVKYKALTSVECCGIGKSKGVLEALYCPTCARRCELKT